MLLRARWIYPVSSPSIEDGFLRVQGGRISEIGIWSECSNQSGVDDLGEVILMPGMVNAHCHLDYTDFIGAIPAPYSFTDWIRAMVDLKADVDDAAHIDSWLNGAQQCLKYGVTTIGNIESRRDLLPELWQRVRLRVVSFIEHISLKPERDVDADMRELAHWMATHQPINGRVGLSPHAPYTTTRDVLNACGSLPGPLAMHVAESDEENRMFREGEGPLYDMLEAAGRAMDDCGDRSPLANACNAGLVGDEFLAVHGNYLNGNDLQVLGANNSSLAHCPRSHGYFQHQPFPAEQAREAGVNLCLGTDSLATMRNPDAELDPLEEVRQFREQHPSFSPEDCIAMVTRNAARAIGMADQAGSLEIGKPADVAVLECGRIESSVAEHIVQCRGPVAGVMINGEWEVSVVEKD